jgi:hypothetical protein
MAIRDSKQLLEYWRELEAANIPLEPLENRVGIDTQALTSGLTIRAARDCSYGRIRELKNGSCAYIVPVLIRRDLPGKTDIREFWLSAGWGEYAWIDPLEDPKDYRRDQESYSFSGDAERYMRDQVLNHRICGVLSRGDIRGGLLLAVGARPPDTYNNHDKAPITLNLVDEWDNLHSATLQMQVSRLPERARTTASRRVRVPLLSRPDATVPSDSLVEPPAPTAQSHREHGRGVRRSSCKVIRTNLEREHEQKLVGAKAG